MRALSDHIVSPANEALEIRVLDRPGAGGACHLYEIAGFNTESNPSRSAPDGSSLPVADSLTVLFQNGPIGEHGVNGVTGEALLAIVIDRLRSFQAGPFPCRENALALTHAETALLWLQKRTQDRIRRSVAGQNLA